MNTLDDHQLDDLLAGASARLHAAVTDVAVGTAPAPSFPMRRVLGIAAAATMAAGTVGVLVSTSGRRGGGLPAGFADGRYGTEITMREVDDGDGNPETVLVRAAPAGGDAQISRGAAAVAQTGVTTPAGQVPPDASTDICYFGAGGGLCGTHDQPVDPALLLSARGPAGQALVYAIPAGVAAVRFEAGAERHWGRPVDGVVAFPFGDDATTNTAAFLVRADGSVVARLDASSTTPTKAEKEARQVSKPTGETLTQSWTLAKPPAGWPVGGTFVRRHGRNVLTGYTGPFVVQQFSTDRTDFSERSSIALVTVPTARAAEVRARLAAFDGSGVDGDVDHGDGTSTLVWVGADVTAADRDRAMAGLAAGYPSGNTVYDLDAIGVWDAGADPGRFGSPNGRYVIDLMTNDVVGSVTIDGTHRRVWAGADDLGIVEYAVEAPADGESPGYSGATIDPRIVIDPPKPGDAAYPGLVVVPPSITALTVTFDDGTTITPTLLDVRPLSDAKLAVFPASALNRTITAVTIG